jgi:hypothetical protein
MICEKCQKPIKELSRSDKQNKLAFRWYGELDKHTKNGIEYERARCKLHYGIPILREEDDDFRQMYDSTFKLMPYEAKLQVIEKMDVPVTRLMTVKQMGRYLDTVDVNSALNGHPLTHPDDLYWESLGVKRG